MEKIVEQGLLYDFYGELLTKHQRQIYEGIVYDNLSLGEIAQEERISRQAVHDIVKRCDRTLQGYEEKLKLIEKFQNIKAKVSSINQLSEKLESGVQTDVGEYSAYGMQIKKLSSEILQEL
ncbi:MAG: DNA-binding protein [Lachnospiraceae bacterium]|nr:DNA-binding protein [Lachnospiraceae bacterium]